MLPKPLRRPGGVYGRVILLESPFADHWGEDILKGLPGTLLHFADRPGKPSHYTRRRQTIKEPVFRTGYSALNPF
jgi:hypothetical protein